MLSTICDLYLVNYWKLMYLLFNQNLTLFLILVLSYIFVYFLLATKKLAYLLKLKSVLTLFC